MTRNIYERSRRNLECLNRDEEFPRGLPRRPDLNAANASQHILIKGSRGHTTAGADAREESKETGHADVLEDVAVDDHRSPVVLAAVLTEGVGRTDRCPGESSLSAQRGQSSREVAASAETLKSSLPMRARKLCPRLEPFVLDLQPNVLGDKRRLHSPQLSPSKWPVVQPRA